MKSIVVYYSLEGNTRAAATELASQLGAETCEIRTVKPYPKRGLLKFLVGGRDSSFGRLPEIEPVDVDPSAYDLVVLALPVWAGKAAAPINAFIQGRNFGNTRVGLVVASASGDADSCARDLASKLNRATANMPTLSLKNPGRMDHDKLVSQIQSFVPTLSSRGGGGGGGGGAF